MKFSCGLFFHRPSCCARLEDTDPAVDGTNKLDSRGKRRVGVDDFTSSPFVKELEVKPQVFSPVGSALVLEILGNSNV